jgi:hypothetical protein
MKTKQNQLLSAYDRKEGNNMTEAEARKVITQWAKNHFADNEEHVVPDVEVLSIEEQQDDEWYAELSISTSEDNPLVTFFVSDIPGHGLQIVSVEY